MKKTALLYACMASSLLFTGCHKQEDRVRQEDMRNQEDTLGAFPTYNPKTEVTIKGQIASVARLDTPSGDIFIVVRTDEGDIPVALGPESFISGGPVQLRPLDEVEIKGSKLVFEGRVIIIAKEISTSKYSLKLRDGDGNALWSNWKSK